MNAEEALHNLPDFVRADIDYDALGAELRMTCENAEPVAIPRVYQVETTARCNLACTFCPRTTDIIKNSRRNMDAEMTLPQFEYILDKMPWLRSLELFHFGEPFMHHNLHDYVAACRRRGIYTVVASNLLPATEPKTDAVFAAGLDFLVMDVDSLDPQRYASMRVNGHMRMLKRRLAYMLNHPKRPYCVVQTICVDGVPEYTEKDLEAFLRALNVHRMPDELRYKFLDSFRGSVTDKGGLGPNDLCRESFYGFSVHVNGDVVPCDRDWAGENVMGNIFQQGVEEIWHSPKYKEFRHRMKSADKPNMCKRCAEGRLFNARSQQHVQVNMFKGAEVEA